MEPLLWPWLIIDAIDGDQTIGRSIIPLIPYCSSIHKNKKMFTIALYKNYETD
jgi:hypothetical protein